MQIKQRAMAWILFLTLIVPGLAFAERRGRLVGKVHDPDGTPIEGVVVTATSPQIPSFKDVQTTDKKGVFTMDFNFIDVTVRYRFEKDGYQSMEANQEWKLEGTQLFEWTMLRATVTTTSTQRTSAKPQPGNRVRATAIISHRQKMRWVLTSTRTARSAFANC